MDSIKNLKKSFKSLKWYEWIMAIIMIAIAGLSVYKAFKNPSSSSTPPWLTIVNFVSAICGVVCIFFCAKASISNYFFGLINTIMYAIYLYYYKIRGTLCLELFVYLPVNIIGWIAWVKHRDKVDTEKTMAKKISIPQLIVSGIFVIAIAIPSFFVLDKLDGKAPETLLKDILDAFMVAIGIVATVLQFKRFREQYVWWLVQDVIAVGMFIVLFDPVYLTKKTIYLIMAVIGLYNWVKLQKTRNEENV